MTLWYRTRFLGAVVVAAFSILGCVAISSAMDPPAGASCPSAEEAARHFEQTGEDFKPQVPCTAEGPVPQELLAAPPAPPERAPDLSHLNSAELQQALDPGNDPYVLVGKGPDGAVEAINVTVREPKGFPTLKEAGVQTPEDFSRWLAGLERMQTPRGFPTPREYGVNSSEEYGRYVEERDAYSKEHPEERPDK